MNKTKPRISPIPEDRIKRILHNPNDQKAWKELIEQFLKDCKKNSPLDKKEEEAEVVVQETICGILHWLKEEPDKVCGGYVARILGYQIISAQRKLNKEKKALSAGPDCRKL